MIVAVTAFPRWRRLAAGLWAGVAFTLGCVPAAAAPRPFPPAFPQFAVPPGGPHGHAHGPQPRLPPGTGLGAHRFPPPVRRGPRIRVEHESGGGVRVEVRTPHGRVPVGPPPRGHGSGPHCTGPGGSVSVGTRSGTRVAVSGRRCPTWPPSPPAPPTPSPTPTPTKAVAPSPARATTAPSRSPRQAPTPSPTRVSPRPVAAPAAIMPRRSPARGMSMVTRTLLIIAPAVLAAAALRPRSSRSR